MGKALAVMDVFARAGMPALSLRDLAQATGLAGNAIANLPDAIAAIRTEMGYT